MNPWWIISIGLFMMLLGVILPFLMVIQILESTWALNFFSYGVSISGLFIAISGVSRIFRGGTK